MFDESVVGSCHKLAGRVRITTGYCTALPSEGHNINVSCDSKLHQHNNYTLLQLELRRSHSSGLELLPLSSLQIRISSIHEFHK